MSQDICGLFDHAALDPEGEHYIQVVTQYRVVAIDARRPDGTLDQQSGMYRCGFSEPDRDAIVDRRLMTRRALHIVESRPAVCRSKRDLHMVVRRCNTGGDWM